MYGYQHVGIVAEARLLGLDDVAAILLDRRGAAEDCSCRRRTERDDKGRVDQLELTLQPLMTRADLQLIRLLVNAPLAAQLELEVLDRIRHVRGLAIDGGIRECAVEELAGRSDEWLAHAIFLVAGLLAYEQDTGTLATHPEDGLRRVPP
jgi:hypothetical protein